MGIVRSIELDWSYPIRREPTPTVMTYNTTIIAALTAVSISLLSARAPKGSAPSTKEDPVKYLGESDSNRTAYEFKEPGLYKLVIDQVVTPSNTSIPKGWTGSGGRTVIDLCVGTESDGLKFEPVIVKYAPDEAVQNRCITGFKNAQTGSEFKVGGITRGVQIMIQPPLERKGIDGNRLKWEAQGYKLEVLVIKEG